MKFLFFLLLVSTYTCTLYCQSSADTAAIKSLMAKAADAYDGYDNEAMLKYSSEASILAQKLFHDTSSYAFFIRSRHERYRFEARDWNGLIDSVEKTVNLAKQLFGEDNKRYFSQSISLARVYGTVGYYAKSDSIIHATLAAFEKTKPWTKKEYKSVSGWYTSMALNAMNNYNLDDAIRYEYKALALMDKVVEGPHIYKAYSYGNLGETYSTLKDFQRSEECYQKEMAIYFELEGEDTPLLINPKFSLANLALQKQQYEIALNKFLALEEFLKKPGAGDIEMDVLVPLHIGYSLYGLKEFEQAEEKYKIALDKANITYGPGTRLALYAATGLTNLYIEKKQYDQAFSIIREANDAAVSNGLDQNTGGQILAKSLYGMCQYLSGIDSQDEEQLAKAKDKLLEVEGLISEIRKTKGAKETEYFNNELSSTYFYLAQNSLRQNQKEEAFLWLEKNKSFQEQKYFNQHQDQFFEIDDKTKNTQDQLLSNLSDIRNKISLLELKGSPISEVILDSLVRAQNDFKEFFVGLKKQYPDYYDFVSLESPVTLKEIQSSLSESQSMLRFSKFQDALLCFIISKDNISVSNFDSYNFESKIEDLRASILENISIKEDTFLLSVLKNIPEITKELIIVPSEELNLIPFEILNFESQKLIEKYQISYASSANLYFNQQRSSTLEKGKLGLFRPMYRDSLEDNSTLLALVRDGSFNLPGAKDESQKIFNVTNGKLFENQMATANHFEQNAKDFQFLHLAMHANLDETNPFRSSLLFSPKNTEESYSELQFLDLLNTDINAHMVVLSACNTGFGKLHSSEGLQGISKAFSYLGVPSIVHSLWKVPDGSTSYIMEEFYKNLAQGQNKNLAMQNAKLSYLNDDAIAASQKTPYHWAGFIVSGNIDPISFSQGLSNSLIYTLGALCFSILLFGFWKRRSRK